MCGFYSWLTSFWLRIVLFRHGSREAFDCWLTWAIPVWAKTGLVRLFAHLPPLTWLTWPTWASRLAPDPRSRGLRGSPGLNLGLGWPARLTECGPARRTGSASQMGNVSYQIRILMYLDVSCVYPAEYMYPKCILMYLKCILNAPFYSRA